MKIYVPDFDNDTVLEFYFDVVNLEALERELDELYPDGWYYDKTDAVLELM